MNWQTTDRFSNEREVKLAQLEGVITTRSMLVENEEKEAVQLKKYLSPTDNAERQAYIDIITRFGVLLTHNAIEEIASTLIAEDCDVYVFNSTERPSMQFSVREEGFSRLYDNIQIKERIVKETYVDLEKNMASQICQCKVLYEGELAEELSFEIFTIQDQKIVKYRATYAPILPLHGPGEIFELTKKDKMIAKVKEINYALAGQPNFEKVRSLLHEDTEYKIWAWDSQKCVTLDKTKFVSAFKDLQKNLRITSIVPYDIVAEGCSVVANYVYHLEEVSNHEHKKFIWLSSTAYLFDKNNNIVRANQMGEIHTEDEDFLPFEVYSRENIIQRIQDIFGQLKKGMDLWYSDLVYFACDIQKFGPREMIQHGRIEGLRDLVKMPHLEKKRWNIEWFKLLDIFVDHNDPSYDAALVLAYGEGTTNFEGDVNKEQKFGIVNFHRLIFENGKLIKMGVFLSEVSDPLDPNASFFK